MLPGCGPEAGSAALFPQPRRSKATTRYPARENPTICSCQTTQVPVLGCSKTIGTPGPPLSTNHSFTPGKCACTPQREGSLLFCIAVSGAADWPQAAFVAASLRNSIAGRALGD